MFCQTIKLKEVKCDVWFILLLVVVLLQQITIILTIIINTNK